MGDSDRWVRSEKTDNALWPNSRSLLRIFHAHW